MAITSRGQYVPQGGTSGSPAVTMIPPAGTAAGDVGVIVTSNKNASVIPADPAVWNILGSKAVGTGADGVGTGQIRFKVWYLEFTGAMGNTGVNVVGSNRVIGGGQVYFKDIGDPPWDIACSFGDDVSSDTAFSAPVTDNLDLRSGEFLLAYSVSTVNTTLSARNIVVPGVTGTSSGINSAGGAVGNHIFFWSDHIQSTGGTQTGPSTSTATTLAATTGGTVHIRIGLQGAARSLFQAFGTKVEGTTTAAIPYPASVAVGELCIAHMASKPFGSFPTWASFAPVASIASGSVANGADTGSTIATHAIRVATTALSGTETATIATGSPALGAMSRWKVAPGKVFDIQNSQAADTTLTTTPVSATGGALQVVPGDTIVITVGVTSDAIVHTSRALAIAGTTLSTITWTDFTATAGNDAGMYVGRCTVLTGSVTAAPVYTATSNVSGQSAAGVDFMRLREIDPALPGPIGIYGDPVVEPESHCWCAPVVDGNGVVWRSGESPIAKDTNRLIVNASTDGGITWAAVDWANHPTAQDLESMWINKVGTKLYHLINRDDTVWLVPFNLSDDAAPNTYGTQEVVESGMSSTGTVQACTNAVLSTGVMHCIYSATLSGANNQIGFKRRTAASTYSARTTFNDGAVNVTGPKAVVGASDVTYVFYKDLTGDTLYYRTISADGATVSARVAVATGAAISSQSMPHTNPVYYDDAGTEVIGVAYINDSDVLKYRELRNGVLQTEETISAAAITRNPGTTDSQSAVASLAVDGKDVHAMWSRGADGDLMRDVRVFGTGWGTDTVVWASAGETGWYIYCDVVTIGTNVYLHYTYDQGIHVDDGSNINYNRILLRTAATDANITASTVSAVASVPAATVQTGSAPAPASTNAVAGIPAATVRLGAAISPAAVTATASVPAATVTASSNAGPASVSAVAAVPAAAAQAGSTVTATSVSASTAIPTPVVQAGGNADVTPASVNATASVPAATVSTGSNTTPSSVAAVTAVPAATARTGSTITPVGVTATAAIPPPAVSAGGSASISPTAVTAVTAIPTPALTTGSRITASTVNAAAAVPAAAVRAGSTVTTPAVVATAAVPAPAVQAGTKAVPATVNATASIPTPAVRLGVLLVPASVAAVGSIPGPTLHTSVLVPAFSVAAVATIPAPVVTSLLPFIPLTEPVAVVRRNLAMASSGTNPAAAAARLNPAEATT